MGNPVPFPAARVGGDMFDNTVLNTLLPMHVQVDMAGRVQHAGPTFMKLLGTGNIVGAHLFDYLQFSYPKGIESERDLGRHYGMPLTVQLKKHNRFDLKSVAVPMADNSGILLNLAFGTSLKNAVSYWNLSVKDFSPSDPTVEMLYMIEVQSALLDESRSLNDRLDGERLEAEEKAYTDPLTGLSNRRALDRYITRMCRRRKPCDFAVFLIDLDHFKAVNDTLGHAAGDKVLQEVANLLLNETRPTDIVVRTGGDEFVLVLQDIPKTDALEAIAKRIISKVERPVLWGGRKCQVGASIGIVQCHTKNSKPIDFYLQAADEALYASKKNGRGTFQFVD
ncbi:MAG: GGDEF domain-containing protein [Amylibacter sp.]|nr:GGDEF domain-containing protein [Amylibacter sp.]